MVGDLSDVQASGTLRFKPLEHTEQLHERWGVGIITTLYPATYLQWGRTKSEVNYVCEIRCVVRTRIAAVASLLLVLSAFSCCAHTM